MSLIDLIRENTKDMRDTIAELERSRLREISQLNAAEERFKRASSIISSQHKQQDEKKSRLKSIGETIRGINQQIDELEAQKQRLLSTLLERQQELEASRQSLSEAEAESNKAQHAAREEKRVLEDIERRVDLLEKETIRNQLKLREVHSQTLDQHLSELEAMFEQEFQEQTKRSETLVSLEAFKRLRHEKREVGDLCDARDEWKKIVKTASVPTVKIAAESELRRIETEIDKLFPGAIKAEAALRHADFIEELHYFVDSQNRTVLLLPFSKDVWNSLNAGTQSLKEKVAVYFFGALAKAIGAEPGKFHYECGNNFVMLVSEIATETYREKNDLVIPLPGGGSISFILSTLPNEIQEALLR
jgi:hypothetical protein